MPRPFNWAQIESGATFHALVGVLLEMEDPDVVVFNREGPDGAIDARSGNRRTVFQSKHHKNATWAQAIADAKGELKKIRNYRQPGHRWHPHWKDAETWTLVTNVPLGTDDEFRWSNEVVPAFAEVGLSAEFIHQPRLETKLITKSELADAFFGGRTRLFLTLAEHREALANQEMLRRAYQIPLEGRVQELERIRRFVTEEDQQVLLVHGSGGVGKSRLLVEAAQRIWREAVVSKVHCATKNLAVSGDWYVGMVPETKALVLLDDPQDPDLIDRLLIELRARAKLWKVIVAVQTPDEPVIRALTNPRERLLAPSLEVGPLQVDDASRYAHALLEPLAMPGEDRSHMAKWLVDVCGRFPVWMTVAVHLLETRGDLRDLPGDRFRIAQGHVGVVLDNTSERLGTRDSIEALLHWLSLLQPLNRHTDDALGTLAREAGFDDAAAVDRAIEDLIRRGVITAYGVGHRIIEIRPHVLRDFFLLDWLTYAAASGDKRASSKALSLAQRLAAQADAEEQDPFTERIITALGRTEFITQPRVPFLDAVAEAAVEAAEKAADTKAQRRVVEFAKPLAPFRSREFTKIASAIRTRLVPEVSNQNPYFPHVVSRASVTRDLPRALLRAAMAATQPAERRAVLKEVIAVVDGEAGSPTARGLDGQGAAEILPKIVHCRHGFRSAFHSEVGVVAAQILQRIETTSEMRESDRVLLKALLEVERHDAYVPEEDPSKLQLEDVRLNPEGPAGRNVIAARERLWSLTGASIGDEPKRFVWKLLDDLHVSLGRASEDVTWKELWVDDLKRCRALVTLSGVTLGEVQLARAVWEWHAAYDDEDSDRKGIALECEAAYLRHPIIAKYAPVFGTEWRIDRRQTAVAALPSPLAVSDLNEYFDGALVFARTHSDEWRFSQVIELASVLGEERGAEEGVQTFIAHHLGGDRKSDLFRVALAAAAARIRVIRTRVDCAALSAALEMTAAQIGDELGVAALLEVLYVHGHAGRGFTRADYDFTLSRDSEFKRMPARQRFEALGRFLAVDEGAADRALNQPEFAGQDETAVAMLWAGYFDGLPPGFGEGEISKPVVERLLDITADVADQIRINSQMHWQIQQILKYVSPKPISWLVAVSRRRLERFREHNRRTRDDRGFHYVACFPDDDSLLMEIVRRIPEAGALEDDVRAIEDLCAIAEGDSLGAHQLPRLLASLDPYGKVVPARAAAALNDRSRNSEPDAIVDQSRFAGWYPNGSVGWRMIAIAACERAEAEGLSEEDLLHVYSCLDKQGPQRWSGAAEGLHPRWLQAVREAQQALDAERIPVLRCFWEWKLRAAEGELERAKGTLEERD